MKMTDASRNEVFTYAWSWDPTLNSLPMLTRDRFIMVLSRGIVNAAMQHASSSALL